MAQVSLVRDKVLHSVAKITQLFPSCLSFMATSPGGARMTSTWLPELLVTSQSYFRNVFLYLAKINVPWPHGSPWLGPDHSQEGGSVLGRRP